MNILNAINAATMGNPKRVYPLVGWTVLEYFLRGAPYGLLLAVVWELFIPLQHPGTPLRISIIVYSCVALLVSLMLLYLTSRKAYFAAYKDSYEICAEGRISIIEHLRKLPMGFFNTRDPGDIGAYIVADYANVEMLFSHLLPQLCGALAAPLVLLVFLASVNLKLAAATALFIPLAVPFAWISTRIIASAGRKHQKSKIDASSRMIEYIQGIRLIKAFNLGGAKFERLEQAFKRLKRDSIRIEAGAGPTMVLASLVLNGGFTFVILFGLTMLLAHEIPLPVYVLFLILGARVYEPLLHALVFMGELHYMKLGVERIEALRKTSPATSGSYTQPIESFEIEFKDICFSYNSVQILKQVSLRIPAKKLTALVGPSGSGKTTLTRLIARFWDVQQGKILLGGRNITDYPADYLLSHISMVFQDVYLFNDTIYNNIRLGRSDATREEIITAAQSARCHEFISTLPDGYETMVGEGGNTLSGGEKQRISIARAILKNAPIVLLDEATASLDPENELYIQQAINELVRDKTVVVIAHRLNTIAAADNIVVLDQGCIVDNGTHNSLLKRDGLYKTLWDEQQQIKGWKFRDDLSAPPCRHES